MAHSIRAMDRYALISGTGPDQATGLIVHPKIIDTMNQMVEAGLIEAPLAPEVIAPQNFLPEHLQEQLRSLQQ